MSMNRILSTLAVFHQPLRLECLLATRHQSAQLPAVSVADRVW